MTNCLCQWLHSFSPRTVLYHLQYSRPPPPPPPGKTAPTTFFHVTARQSAMLKTSTPPLVCASYTLITTVPTLLKRPWWTLGCIFAGMILLSWWMRAIYCWRLPVNIDTNPTREGSIVYGNQAKQSVFPESNISSRWAAFACTAMHTWRPITHRLLLVSKSIYRQVDAWHVIMQWL